MSDTDPKPDDIFGIRPWGEAANTLAKGAVEGARAFLGRICNPAAEELGLLLKDQVRAWRLRNAVNIALMAEKKLAAITDSQDVSAHPRLVGAVIDNGSWCDAETVQEMWAGLLASSCSSDVPGEENLIFINLLAQMTSGQALILLHLCENTQKTLMAGELVVDGSSMTLGVKELQKISGISDVARLDRELDHLRTLGLIRGGLGPFLKCDEISGELRPTALALNMYVRCQGSLDSPKEFFRM